MEPRLKNQSVTSMLPPRTLPPLHPDTPPPLAPPPSHAATPSPRQHRGALGVARLFWLAFGVFFVLYHLCYENVLHHTVGWCTLKGLQTRGLHSSTSLLSLSRFCH
jgi:hypothetical protein